MEADEFAERLARIRKRFATTLTEKVDDSFACVPKLMDKNDDAVETLVVTHRKLHEICGIAPSIGFSATGLAARAAETVLRKAATAKRSLTDEEVTAFIVELGCLRAAAQFDLQARSCTRRTILRRKFRLVSTGLDLRQGMNFRIDTCALCGIPPQYLRVGPHVLQILLDHGSQGHGVKRLGNHAGGA